MLDLPAVDFDLLTRYYGEEPWGAWRDNLHAAIIAREIRVHRTGKRANIDDFMAMQPERRRRKNMAGLVDALRSMAGNKRIPASEYKPPKRGKRGPSKTRSPARSPIRPTTRGARKG